MKKFLLFISVVALISSCGSFGKILKSNDIDYKYKKAVEYYNDKKYSYVIQIFGPDFFPLLKGTKEFEEAFYMYAYSHYYEKDYFNSENLFRQFCETFTTSPRIAEIEYMRAYTYYRQSPKIELEQTNTVKTIGMMSTFANKYPESKEAKEAFEIIEKCKAKIELKELKAAELYYNIGQYKAAAIAFNNMLLTFPETNRGDEYKYMSIKAFYLYAGQSVEERKEERYEQLILDCNDFVDKFPESKLITEVEKYNINCANNIKTIKNEQTKKTTSS